MKSSRLTILSILAFAFCALCGCSDQEKPIFSVGFDPDSKPFCYIEDGQYCGFDLDLAREVARRNNWEIVLKKIDWENKNAELNTGNIDCLWSCFSIDGRENDYAWTRPYMENSIVVMVKPNSPIKTLADLNLKSIALQKETTAQQVLGKKGARSDIGKKIRKTILTGTMDEAIAELNAGNVDAVLLDYEVAKQLLNTGKYRILNEALIKEKYGVGFAKDNTKMRDAVDKTLDEMISDGTAAKIARKYFDYDVLIER